jgi:hypothetical protein
LGIGHWGLGIKETGFSLEAENTTSRSRLIFDESGVVAELADRVQLEV